MLAPGRRQELVWAVVNWPEGCTKWIIIGASYKIVVVS